jgi:hypothetical protein
MFRTTTLHKLFLFLSRGEQKPDLKSIFYDVIPCSLVKVTDVSEEYTATILSVKGKLLVHSGLLSHPTSVPLLLFHVHSMSTVFFRKSVLRF